MSNLKSKWDPMKNDDILECFSKGACVMVYCTNEENIGDLGTVSACPSHLKSSLSV